jgi:hypothetical protein
VFSPQVLPEVVLPGPILGFIPTLAHVTTVDRLVTPTEFVNTSLMPIKVVVGTESLDRLCASGNITFERFIVSRLVFTGHSASVKGQESRGNRDSLQLRVRLDWNIANRADDALGVRCSQRGPLASGFPVPSFLLG